MSTSISARARIRVHQPGPVLLQVAVAGETLSERLVLTVDGARLPMREHVDGRGGRHHICDTPAGLVEASYDAIVVNPTPVPDLGELDRLEMLRPSRFCPSDLLRERPVSSLEEVEPWVNAHLSYVLDSSGAGEDALQTMRRGTGVCRDFAHLVVTLCRSLDVPARVFSAYAPGLEPEDFHLVAEVWDSGRWHVFDATRLVDTSQLVRICTGRDAADTAWMSTFGPDADLEMVDVQVS